ncbi:MAG: type II toxin-antitoxin system death-on-curing family toxin [Candidatus Aenigmarchaeota archaeon]|nr:type II toxin-antitoxin system death-on-curing family toxin [Candidatus Aenigmarchaeota archaeon]
MKIVIRAIIQLHDKIIRKSGGHAGMINVGNLDFTVAQANYVGNLTKKLATLLFGIVARHPFVDGNKRTALVVVEAILRTAGKRLTAGEKDLWVLLNKISIGEMNVKQIAEWLSKNIA